jgi:hypothetical protein
MVVNRALRATGCMSCRLSLLTSFTSLAGPSIRAPQVSTKLPGCYTSSQQFRRLAHDSHHRDIGSTGQAREVQESIVEKEEETQALKDLEVLSEDKQLSAVPWYLQVESPQRAPQPISDRQRIPDLPEAPPPILQSLLQQVSIDLGMDDLSLLDLRKLNPPPALGANLLMLIGTARSERHLHVSADRLCRWLRSTHKLRPDADGLLGRNELKLKLRRKAKRAKLLGSADENADDGVRTGWVCVDVGIVEGVVGEAGATLQHTDFVGFGRRTDGVRIVVQLLTEEKRTEIDLEKLWGSMLKRGGQTEIEGFSEDADLQSSQIASGDHGLVASSIDPRSSGPSSILGQTRGFHTVARRFMETTETSSPSSPNHQPPIASPFEDFDLRGIQESVLADITSGHYEKAKNDLLQYTQHVPQLQGGGWRPFLLDLLRVYLENCPVDVALKELGEGDSDHNSTQFLACFYDTLSTYPSPFEAETKIWLNCYAREIGHPAYYLEGLLDIFEDLQDYGVEISQPSYIRVLRSVLRARPEKNYHGPRDYALQGAVKILQTMHDQGLQVLTEEILVELQMITTPEVELVVRPGTIYTDSTDTYDFPSLPMAPIQARLHTLITSVNLPLFSDESRTRLLELHARHQNWLEFWEIFRMAPRRGKPNSASMYAFMFGTVAQSKHQRGCMNVLRSWVPDMAREDPPVLLEGSVGEAVRECLRVADPYIEHDILNSPDVKGEWLSLWQQIRWSNGKHDPFLYE